MSSPVATVCFCVGFLVAVLAFHPQAPLALSAVPPATSSHTRAAVPMPRGPRSRREAVALVLGGGLSGGAGAAFARGEIREDEPEDAPFDKKIVGAIAAISGIAVGIAAPTLYNLAEKRDIERVAEIRELNRKKFKETGQTLTDEEIAELRPGRWTDRREFADDD